MKGEKEKIFMQMYEPVHRNFVKFCKARVYGEMDFRDLMHDTLLIAYQKFEKVNEPKAFLSFLFGISIRVLSNTNKKKKTILHNESYEAMKIEQTNDFSEAKTDVTFLYEALSKLPENQRESLILYEIVGFSVKEIAELHGAGESAVKQRLARGRQQLIDLVTEKEEQVQTKKNDCMNEDKLNALFREIREEKIDTSIADVHKWIALSAASAGLFGLLSQYKLPLLLTKKMMIMTTLIATIGIGIGTFILSPVTSNRIYDKPVITFEAEPTPEITLPPIEIKQNDKVELINPEKQTERGEFSQLVIDNLPYKNALQFNKITGELQPLFHLSIPQTKEEMTGIEDRQVGQFTRVKVGSSFNVFISQGENDLVRLEVDERYINQVITEVKAGELQIYFKSNSKIKNADKLDVYLTMKTIEGFHFSGAINAKSTKTLQANKVQIDCSGASDIDFDLNCEELNIICSGASELDLKGKTQLFELNSSGASEVNAYSFYVENSKMTVSGASEIKCNVAGDLKISASGASDVNYKGNPKTVDVKSTGASSIKKMQ